MRVRILSEWAGSGRCGAVCEVPDAQAVQRIAGGWAEAVPAPPSVPLPLELATIDVPVETAVNRKPKGRRG